MYQLMKSDKQAERIKREFSSIFSRFNWAGVEMIPERNVSFFAESAQLNRKLETIFKGDKKETSKRV